jgi:multisubunit Na+/H+ antiporter MnhB subunit
MSPRWIRRIVLVTFVLGIAGMIVASIAERTGAALTAGLVTAVAMLCLVLVTSVAPPDRFGSPIVDEEAAADVERRVSDLVSAGVDEAELRSLVRAVRRLHRQN